MNELPAPGLEPTSNIFGRTFLLKIGNRQGTGFTVDVDGRRYLITAQHVVGQNDLESVIVKADSGYKEVGVELVGYSSSDLDVTVLSPKERLHEHKFRLEVGGQDDCVAFGQDAYCLGFPFGLATCHITHENFTYPLAFVRKLHVSGFDGCSWYLDGFVNPGISGGPVVVMSGGAPTLIGVVSRRRQECNDLTRDGEPTGLQLWTNAGLVVATPIQHAMDLIRRNPIGFPLR